jgi:hypothetical protein
MYQDNEKVIRQGMGYKDKERIDWGNEIGEDFEAQHKKYKVIIREILESYDKATNNDLILCFEFWNLMEQIKITQSRDNKEIIVRIQKDKVPFIVVPESIRRARQSLNAQGIGLAANPEVLEMRKKRSKAIRDYFSRENYINKARSFK